MEEINPKPNTSRGGTRSLNAAFGANITKRGTGSTDVKGSEVITKQAAADVKSTSAFWYSPELTQESFLLPKSRQEILKWCRIFYNLEPYIGSILDMHSLYPFSKFDIITPDKSVTEFYKEMAFNENFDLYSFMLKASLSYQKFGEAIIFLNKEKIKDGPWAGKVRWSKGILLEPELVEIQQAMFEAKPVFEMIPTQEMKKLVDSLGSGNDERLKQIPPAIINAVQTGKNIVLDSTAVSAIQNLTDPSATRGTPIMQRCFKVLIFQDKIRLAQMAAADRYHFPVELWTVGDLGTNILPTTQELEDVRSLITSAISSPPFSLVFPPIIKYEALGVTGKLLPLSDDYTYIQDQLMVALGVNKNIIMGEGPSFSGLEGMSLQKLIMVYKTIRDEFENWMINKFFRPIALENNFYYYVGNVKKLILPQISWYKSLDIKEEETEKESYIKLHERGYVSTKTLFSKFPNLDFDTETKHLEMEKATIFDKEDRIPKEFIPTTQVNTGDTDVNVSTTPGDTGAPGPQGVPGPGQEETAPVAPETSPETETVKVPESTEPATEVPSAGPGAVGV